MDPMWEEAARQLLRAVRGARSQVAYSRRLGFKSNVAADWEVGRRTPNTAATLDAMARMGIDVEAAMRRFHPTAAEAWRNGGVAAWLDALRGGTPKRDLAVRCGLSAPQIGRWLRGDADPKLPELLAVLDAATGRAGDWVGELVDITLVPALEPLVRSRREVLQLVWREPWTAAVLAALSTRRSGEEPVSYVAERLSLPPEFVRPLLEVLVRGGAVAGPEHDYAVRGITVDVPAAADDLLRVRRHWAEVAAGRLQHALPTDRFLFNICAVSQHDLRRIVELQVACFREIRSIVAASEPAEEVVLVTMHTLGWPAHHPPRRELGEHV